MFRFLAICALATIAAAAPGYVADHHVVAAAPVVAKVVHSTPLATSHQSFTQFHNQAVLTPVVKTVPVVQHVAPVVKTITPAVHHVAHVEPVVKTLVPAAPIVKTVVAPVVQHQTYVSPVSVVKTLPHAVSHQSHTQIHQKTYITPVVAAPVVKTIVSPVVPVVKHAVAAAPVAHIYHH